MQVPGTLGWLLDDYSLYNFFKYINILCVCKLQISDEKQHYIAYTDTALISFNIQLFSSYKRNFLIAERNMTSKDANSNRSQH